MSYSLVERTVDVEYGALLEDRGIGVVVWSPLAGGFLTGKYTRDDPGGGGGRLQTFYLQPLDRERGDRGCRRPSRNRRRAQRDPRRGSRSPGS